MRGAVGKLVHQAHRPTPRDGGPSRQTAEADFTAFVHGRYGRLVRTALLLTGDRGLAEDVVQNALAKLYLAWGRLRPTEHPDAYVRRIVVNEANSLWHKPWRHREVPSDFLPDAAIADNADDIREIWAWVATLPKDQRAVIVLRYYEGLPETEIAEVLQIRVGTVKSRSHRALAALRTRIPQGFETGEER